MRLWQKVLIKAQFGNSYMNYYLVLPGINILELFIEVLVHFILSKCGYL